MDKARYSCRVTQIDARTTLLSPPETMESGANILLLNIQLIMILITKISPGNHINTSFTDIIYNRPLGR